MRLFSKHSERINCRRRVKREALSGSAGPQPASCRGGRVRQENSVALSGSLCGQTVPVNDMLCHLKLLAIGTQAFFLKFFLVVQALATGIRMDSC